MATVDPQTTQLEFYQAMADFKTMFPSMDDDVIEAVLRSNEGAVDATIDQLLAMSTDYENEKIRLELDLKESVKTTDQLVPIDDSDIGGGIGAVSPARNIRVGLGAVASSPTRGAAKLPLSSRWSCSHLLLGTLPDDFLRLAPDTSQSEMELEDERIAALLQNEEFMKELRWNKDFISTLDRGNPLMLCVSLHDEQKSPHEERVVSSFPLRIVDDEAVFKERLKHMGKLSKKKFSQLGRVFTGRKKRGAKSILNENATKDSLLLREDQDSD